MDVCVIGSGAREHALGAKIRESPLVDKLYFAPGNAGTSTIGINIQTPRVDTPEGLVALKGILRDRYRLGQYDLIVPGSEASLAAGIANIFWPELRVFGPFANGARLEADKLFAKHLMDRAGIRTPEFDSFCKGEHEKAITFLRNNWPEFSVIKAAGLANGKGVFVYEKSKLEDAAEKIRDLLVYNRLGRAGSTILLERRLYGPETSLILFTDGRGVAYCPPAYDYKRLDEGDTGPNTGGMGAYSAGILPKTHLKAAIEGIVSQTISQLGSQNPRYCGLLYLGLLKDSPSQFSLIEYNVRLGDPEAQALLVRMDSDIIPVMEACVNSKLSGHPGISWSGNPTVCVVLVTGGYPNNAIFGDVEISGLEGLESGKGVRIYHGSTFREGGKLYAHQGRILSVVGSGETLAEARAHAYDAVRGIEFEGKRFRRDIARDARDI